MSEPESSFVKSVKDYFASKDYRFYIAASATVILAGAGLYYFWSPKPPRPKRQKRQRTTRPAGNADAGTCLILITFIGLRVPAIDIYE
jgi:hypothetical protein